MKRTEADAIAEAYVACGTRTDRAIAKGLLDRLANARAFTDGALTADELDALEYAVRQLAYCNSSERQRTAGEALIKVRTMTEGPVGSVGTATREGADRSAGNDAPFLLPTQPTGPGHQVEPSRPVATEAGEGGATEAAAYKHTCTTLPDAVCVACEAVPTDEELRAICSRYSSPFGARRGLYEAGRASASRPVANGASAIPELRTSVFFVELSENDDAGWFIATCGAGDNKSTGFHLRAEAESVAASQADDGYSVRVVEYVRAGSKEALATAGAFTDGADDTCPEVWCRRCGMMVPSRDARVCNVCGFSKTQLSPPADEEPSRPVAVGSKARAEEIHGQTFAGKYRDDAYGGELMIAALDRAQFFADPATLAEIDRLASEIERDSRHTEGLLNGTLWHDAALALATAVRKLGIGGGK